MKARPLILFAALAGAAALLVWGDNRPASDIAEPVARAQPGKPPVRANDSASPSAVLPLRSRSEAAAPAQEAALFASTDWTPAAPSRAEPPPMELAGPPLPVLPPLPYTYLGKAQSEGQWQVFLARGNQTYVVSKQMLLDNDYRVDAIAPPWLKLTYLPQNRTQQIHIGDFN